MKKTRRVFFGLLVCLAAFVVVSCATTGTTDGGNNIAVYANFTRFSVSAWLTDGSVDFSSKDNPVTGNDITGATVIASSETTGNFIVLTWVSSTAAGQPNGFYFSNYPLVEGTGESISLIVMTSNQVITGGPTQMPDTGAAVIDPSHGATVNLPFTVTWEVFNQTADATHCWFIVQGYDPANSDDYHQEILPISQKSFTVTSSHLSETGNYALLPFPANAMNFSGAKNGSVGYIMTRGELGLGLVDIQ